MIFYLYFVLYIIYMISLGIYKIVYSIAYKIKIKKLLDSINNTEDLLYMKYKDLIHVVAEVFIRKGYKVEYTDKCGEDSNGIILNDTQYVEIFKLPLASLIEIETAMKLNICMQMNSVYRGMLITLGDYKRNTKRYCFKNVIECIDGNNLLQMCKDVQTKAEAFELN